jgi:hypothetical protein
LSKDEVEKIFIDNPQNHKEAGFEKWWASQDLANGFKLHRNLVLCDIFLREKNSFFRERKNVVGQRKI